MYRIAYVLGEKGEALEEALRTLLACLTMCNRLYLRTHKGKVPQLYKSGVRYEEEYGEADDWQDIPTTRALGYGDAEDLACWRAAELQEQGVMAWPTFEKQHGCLHPKVRLADGRIEDPAAILGMRGHTKPCVGISHPGALETRVHFCMQVFRGSKAPQAEQELAHQTLRLMLGALTIIDVGILTRYPQLPNLYDPRAGVYYEIEPAGREDWQDALTTFRRKSADCVPVTSLVLRGGSGDELVPIGSLVPGDGIMGDGTWTRVKDVLSSGVKPILALDLNNGSTLRCTKEHRLFLADGTEVRAESVRVGQDLCSLGRRDYTKRLLAFVGATRVAAIREEKPEACCDIETDSGRFYLPECDLVVHNCEDLASHRAAELQVRQGIAAWPSFTFRMRPSGAHLYHIQTRYPDGRIEDPSRVLGMGRNTGI